MALTGVSHHSNSYMSCQIPTEATLPPLHIITELSNAHGLEKKFRSDTSIGQRIGCSFPCRTSAETCELYFAPTRTRKQHDT